MARLTGLLLAGLAVGAIVAQTPGIVLGDGDPASDVLLQQDVFLPYQPQVCKQVQTALATTTRRSSTAGYPVKVAVIGSVNDLGAVPQFFGRPAAYADFLGKELGSFSAHLQKKVAGVPLLVAMPQGLALVHAGPAATDVVKKIKVSSGADPNELARAAVKAVPDIATAAGHPIQPVKIESGCSQKQSTVLFFAIPIVLLLVAGFLIRFRRPREESESPPQAASSR
jgi:hypothetical protein